MKAPCVDDQYVADIYVNLLVKGGPAHMSGRIVSHSLSLHVDDLWLLSGPDGPFSPEF